MEGMEQLDTTISFRDGGSGIARELQRAHTRGNASRSERNLLAAFRDISSWCDQFSLPKTISDIAKQLYKRSDEEKLLRGKPLDAVIAACIFIACRQAHVPRTFREICNLTNVSKKVLGQCYKALEQAFNLTPGASQDRHTSAPTGTTGAEDLLVRYCNHLALPPNVQPICADIIVKARELGIADGRSPVSIAGGAIYFTCCLLDKPKSIRDISSVAGVSEGTIKSSSSLLSVVSNASRGVCANTMRRLQLTCRRSYCHACSRYSPASTSQEFEKKCQIYSDLLKDIQSES